MLNLYGMYMCSVKEDVKINLGLNKKYDRNTQFLSLNPHLSIGEFMELAKNKEKVNVNAFY